jgi:hypothetical protein
MILIIKPITKEINMKNTWKPTCGGYIPSDNDNIVDMKTIAQQLNIKEFPFEIRDKNGNQIYFEYSNGSWYKQEYDSNGNKIYYENSYGDITDNRPKPTCNGKVVEIDGKKYKLIRPTCNNKVVEIDGKKYKLIEPETTQ